MLALPIFPVRLQTSIFGADELNCRVRDGNGWTLIAISTDSASSQARLREALLGIYFNGSCPAKSILNCTSLLPLCQGLFLSLECPTLQGEWYTFRDSNPGHPD